MKITFISDTHNKHKHLTSKAYNNILGEGDVLVHAGDCTSMGKSHEIYDFLNWLSDVPYKHKVFIAGNHDFGFELMTDIDQSYKDKGVHYLFDNSVTIDGVKFYGSPWQPWFYDWAFNLPRNGWEIEQKWSEIPSDTDILITHGPAYGILDATPSGQRVGCELLYKKVVELQPKIHVSGHIHHSYGEKYFNETTFLNASVLNEKYQYENKPISLEFDVNDKKIVEYYV